MALHGIPRSTLDIDIVVPAQAETIIKVFKTAESIGLKSQQSDMVSLANKPGLIIGQWVSFQDRKKRQLLDVFFEQEKQFEKLRKHSIKRRYGKITFPVVSLSDLEKLKRSSGRPVDLADIGLIQEVKKMRRLQ